MADRTSIEWTDASWNPIRGCSLVSAGCANCYAMKQAHRFGGVGQPYDALTELGPQGTRWTGQVRLVPELLDQPLRWRKPRRIFVCSMSDLFHENVPDDFIDRVFAVMALAPQHTFQVLTKRPARMGRYFCQDRMGVIDRAVEFVADRRGDVAGRVVLENLEAGGWPLPNVWLGVSVEDQKTADERIPLLLQIPAAVRWISAEPVLEPIDLSQFIPLNRYSSYRAARGAMLNMPGLDWVVIGGESGPGARPMHPDWARSIRDQCVAAGVPFFFKQWGDLVARRDHDPKRLMDRFAVDRFFKRVGKKAAGRVLDDRTWDEFPA